jgi:hypothetical protein
MHHRDQVLPSAEVSSYRMLAIQTVSFAHTRGLPELITGVFFVIQISAGHPLEVARSNKKLAGQNLRVITYQCFEAFRSFDASVARMP